MTPAFLIIDDDKIQCALYKEFLNEFNYKIDTANSAREGIELIKLNNYIIIIADKNMPGVNGNNNMGGMDLLKYVQKNLTGTEIIMMTGYATIETAIEAMKLGAFDYLIKPFARDDLINTVNRILEYKAFINPENTINIYKNLHHEIINIFEKTMRISDEEKHKILRVIESKIDHFFRTQKNLEKIVITQRDALSNIATCSGQLLPIAGDSSSIKKLITKIIDESNKRI